MAVKIRLMRIGAKKRPFYRVVAVNERSKRNGRYLELLGTYNPLTEPKEIILKKDRIDYWVKTGALLSDGYLRITKQAPQKPPRKPKKEKEVKEPKEPEVVEEKSEEPEKPEEQKPEIVEEVKTETDVILGSTSTTLSATPESKEDAGSFDSTQDRQASMTENKPEEK